MPTTTDLIICRHNRTLIEGCGSCLSDTDWHVGNAEANTIRDLGLRLAEIMDTLALRDGDEAAAEAAVAIDKALDYLDAAIRSLEEEPDEDEPTVAPAPAEPPTVVCLMAALEASLAAVKRGTFDRDHARDMSVTDDEAEACAVEMRARLDAIYAADRERCFDALGPEAVA